MVVGCQPYAPAAFTPKKCSWYSFPLEAESTPGPFILTVGKLNQYNSADEIRKYKQNWLHHVNRKENNSLLNYNNNMNPMEKNISRPRRKWRVQDHLNVKPVPRAGLNSSKITKFRMMMIMMMMILSS